MLASPGTFGYTSLVPSTISVSGLAIPELLPTAKIPTGRRLLTSDTFTHGHMSKEEKERTVLNLFVLGSLIFLFIFTWVTLINILINVYFETVHPSTVVINQGITEEDLVSAIYKQLVYAVIVTIILILFYWLFW